MLAFRPRDSLAHRHRRFRLSLIVFAIATMVSVTSYALTPNLSYAASGYPGPDALPGVPTYGNALGTITLGHSSHLTWVCGFDAPNATNHSPKYAVATINGKVAALLPISTQYGCASFYVSVSSTDGHGHHAPPGYSYVSVNGGPWILVKDGQNWVLVTGVKHYHHVGAYFGFYIPVPTPPTTTTSTIPSTTTPNTLPPTTIPGQTTTTRLTPPSTTTPGYRTTTSRYNAGSTSTRPTVPGSSPGSVGGALNQVVTVVAVVVAAGAAATAAGGLVDGIPEALVEEYLTEIPPGGGLPYSLFPTGGVGIVDDLAEGDGILGVVVDSETPPGGGLPVGSSAPGGSDFEGDAGAVDVFVADDDVPAGGGIPFGPSAIFSGGIDELEDDNESTGGGD